MSDTSTAAVPRGVDEVSPGWLTSVLGGGRVAAVAVEPLDAGVMASTSRLLIEWEEPGSGPSRAIAKLSAADARSREAAAHHRSFEIETAFYTELAPSLPARVPACLWAGADDRGSQGLLLEDLWPAATGDQVAGCSADAAAAAAAELARFHAARWDDPALARLPWLNRFGAPEQAAYAETARASAAPFLDRYGDALGAEITELVLRFVELVESYDPRGQLGPRTVVHGDYRNDNLLFGDGGVSIVDWQAVRLANGLVDLAYFLGGGLEPAVRRGCEEAIVREYHARLTAGGVALTWDDCWQGYRWYAFAALTRALTTAPAVRRDERSDAMFLAMARRSATLALDLDALTLLEERR